VRRLAGGRRNGRRDWWPWVSLIPLGLGAFAPAIAGRRCRRWSWIALGLLWFGTALAGWVITIAAGHHPRSSEGRLAGLLVLAAWVGGILTSFAIRGRYELVRGSVPTRERLTWPTPTAESRSWTVRYALGAYVATFAYAAVLGLLLIDVLGLHVQIGVGGLLVDAGLVASLLPLARRGRLSPADLGLRPTLGARSVALVVLALCAYAAVGGLWVLAFARHAPAARFVGSAHPGAVNEVLDIIALSVSAPVVEEIFFRGLLYRSLRNRLPVLPAALLAGCLFGLVHILGYPLITLPVKAAFGVIACLLYERTGSLLPGIALHAFVDASAADLAFTGNDSIVLICSGALALLVLVGTRVERLMRADRAQMDTDSGIAGAGHWKAPEQGSTD
jgi:membrane protease YdiL (CAAX protease family)